jgi:hypothetical protein
LVLVSQGMYVVATILFFFANKIVTNKLSKEQIVTNKLKRNVRLTRALLACSVILVISGLVIHTIAIFL